MAADLLLESGDLRLERLDLFRRRAFNLNLHVVDIHFQHFNSLFVRLDLLLNVRHPLFIRGGLRRGPAQKKCDGQRRHPCLPRTERLSRHHCLPL
jgi:hypothetical protein